MDSVTRRWFDGSKVVDIEGKPLPVYHGTNQPIDKFSKERKGMNSSHPTAKTGFFFTDNPEIASDYAALAGRNVRADVSTHEKKSERLQKETDRLERIAQRTGKNEDWDAYSRAAEEFENLEIGSLRDDPLIGQNVVPVYLKIVNPMVLDAKGNSINDIGGTYLGDAIAKAKALKNDGVIIHNLNDAPTMNIPCTHYIVFSPNQIKSVFVGKPVRETKEESPLPIPATQDNIVKAKTFVLKKWQERAAERGKTVDDLSNACKFSSMFAQRIFGGTIQGNYDHQYLVLSDRVIDLNDDAMDVQKMSNPYRHDKSFFGKKDHKASMKSCEPRVEKWVEEFIRNNTLKFESVMPSSYYNTASMPVYNLPPARKLSGVEYIGNTVVYLNPSVNDFSKLMQQSLENKIRIMVASDNLNFAAWPAYELTHDEVSKKIPEFAGKNTNYKMYGREGSPDHDFPLRIGRFGATLLDYGGNPVNLYRLEPVLRKALMIPSITERVEPKKNVPNFAKIISNPNFQQWFSGSKIVDKKGNPLPVFHGTISNFSSFDPEKSNSKSKTGVPNSAFLFSTSPENAESYAGQFTWMTGHKEWKEGGSVLPIFLNIKKPLKVDARGDDWNNIRFKDDDWDINHIIKYAQRKGYDGLIVKNVVDTGEGSSIKATTIVAFRPDQIKSVFSKEFKPTDDISEEITKAP